MKAQRILPVALALALAIGLATPSTAMAASKKTCTVQPVKTCTVYQPVKKTCDTKKDDKKVKMIDFTLIPSSTRADEQKITVWCSGSEGSSFVGWQPSYEGAKYTSTKNFVNITDDREFEVTSNGWYAACKVDKNGNFEYRLIKVTNIISFDKDCRGGFPDPSRAQPKPIEPGRGGRHGGRR